MVEGKEELKSLLMKVKEKKMKKLASINIQKTKILASGPISSWQIDGETMETVTEFIFLGSKITADGDCSHENKRSLFAPWKESYEQPRQRIKKQGHYFTHKRPYRQRHGFSGSMVVNGDLLQEGLCRTQVCCTQRPCPRSSPLLTHTSSADTQTQFCFSLCGVSGHWCAQGMFEPSGRLWRVWGLILKAILLTVLLGLLRPWSWGISSKSLQRFAAASPAGAGADGKLTVAHIMTFLLPNSDLN